MGGSPGVGRVTGGGGGARGIAPEYLATGRIYHNAALGVNAGPSFTPLFLPDGLSFRFVAIPTKNNSGGLKDNKIAVGIYGIDDAKKWASFGLLSLAAGAQGRLLIDAGAVVSLDPGFYLLGFNVNDTDTLVWCTSAGGFGGNLGEAFRDSDRQGLSTTPGFDGENLPATVPARSTAYLIGAPYMVFQLTELKP